MHITAFAAVQEFAFVLAVVAIPFAVIAAIAIRQILSNPGAQPLPADDSGETKVLRLVPVTSSHPRRATAPALAMEQRSHAVR